MWAEHWVKIKSEGADVTRAPVKIKSGRAQEARGLVKIKSGRAEVARCDPSTGKDYKWTC